MDVSASVTRPSTLDQFTRSALILPELREQDPAGVIQELSRALQREGFVQDLLPFYHAALNQELMASSVLKSGLAFPHGRMSGVKQLQFAYGRAPRPLTWGPKGSALVQHVFLLAVPPTDAVAYLHVLASLARLGEQPEQLSELRAARNTESILAVLGKVKLRHG